MSLVCYLAHPVGGGHTLADLEARQHNIGNALAWLRWLVDHTGFSVCVPWLPYVMALDEGIYRERGIRDDKEILERCDIVALCGGRVSPGMEAERDHAKANAIPVFDLTSLGFTPPALQGDMAAAVVALRAGNALKAKPRRVWLPPITPSDLYSLRAVRGQLRLAAQGTVPDAFAFLDAIIAAAEQRA